MGSEQSRANLSCSGNWALVTRKEEMRRWWRPARMALSLGYMIGSPTSDRAQCLICTPQVRSCQIYLVSIQVHSHLPPLGVPSWPWKPSLNFNLDSFSTLITQGTISEQKKF